MSDKQLHRGSIIWARLRGPNGELILDGYQQPKARPSLVLSSSTDIEAGNGLVVAAISTQFDRRNLPPHWFSAPSQPGGHPITGLDQPCVVKSDWLCRILVTDVIRISPSVSGRLTRQVLNWLNSQH
ncbi:MAG: type II toxin-antitoxin system PemK/MazF family toxin [Planctomycetes bacterium]|nr:type II toxin-antitoxin system PemK/MazF family toxin [Planctomycetota bacterium]